MTTDQTYERMRKLVDDAVSLSLPSRPGDVSQFTCDGTTLLADALEKQLAGHIVPGSVKVKA